jgi:hypothetical protein
MKSSGSTHHSPARRGRPLGASFLVISCVGLSLMTGMPAAAQVGPSLVIKPWGSQPHRVETNDEPIFINGGHTQGDNHSIKTIYYNSYGRVKLDDPDNANPDVAIGYRATVIDINSKHPALPSGLTDVAVVGAFKLGELESGWAISLIAGAGTSNDNHFRDKDAFYGIGTVNAMKQVDESSWLNIGLTHDGNRVFLPDVPLPYVVYSHRVSDDFSYNLGLPHSSLVWKPSEPVTLEIDYTIPLNFGLKATYDLSDAWSVFAQYARTFDGFHLDDRNNTRMFYDLSRISVGLRLTNKSSLDARIGVGYAFEQEFSTGFDVRDTTTLAEPSDEALFFFTIKSSF